MGERKEPFGLERSGLVSTAEMAVDEFLINFEREYRERIAARKAREDRRKDARS